MQPTSLQVRLARSLRALALLLFIGGPALQAAVHEVHLLLALDNDASTGCSVALPGANPPFEGVEEMLTTTVDAAPISGNVVAVVRRACGAGDQFTRSRPHPARRRRRGRSGSIAGSTAPI